MAIFVFILYLLLVFLVYWFHSQLVTISFHIIWIAWIFWFFFLLICVLWVFFEVSSIAEPLNRLHDWFLYHLYRELSLSDAVRKDLKNIERTSDWIESIIPFAHTMTNNSSTVLMEVYRGFMNLNGERYIMISSLL
jgi:amino acid transporter